MTKETTPAGLLSKVVKFVRHPATSWNDLDTMSESRDQNYSKQALKEMIERKRRNDFVRKREFDMLRKLRNQPGSVERGYGGRPSFFQSSYSSRPDDRAGTLKKIDEIEAQMSQQWWKTKQRDSQAVEDETPPQDAIDTIRGYRTTIPNSQHMATEPMPLEGVNRVAESSPRQAPAGLSGRVGGMSDVRAGRDPEGDLMARTAAGPSGRAPTPPVSDPLPSRPAEAGPSSGFKASAFTPSKFYALDVQELAMDPDIEEAAIRFASGDETSTEQGLLDVLTRKENGGTPDEWMALFDLYRATGRADAFESRAIDYANRFSRSAPAWYSLPDEVAARTVKSTSASSDKPRAAWVADADLDPHMVTMLTKVLERTPQPWVLDWSGLRTVDEAAVPRLLKLFTDWARADVELRFLGVRNLRNVLMELAPSGNRTVEQPCWNLHLAVLRVLNLPDDFELTALDFCVTFEISPPGWEPPKCQFRDLDAEAAGQAYRLAPAPARGHTDFAHSTGSAAAGARGGRIDPNATSSFSFLPTPPAELTGELLGDPQMALAQLDEALGDSAVRVVSCRYLIRVDFSAAGAILNWASGHHAQGREIRFVDVHRLISAFFHVIGITEYAKVTTRED